MAARMGLGDLERTVMECLWSAPGSLTVREVHASVSENRNLAYTTIMTVLQRLAKKNLVLQRREDRAHRYQPRQGRAQLVAELMSSALDQVADSYGREAALVHFVEHVGADEATALRRALSELEGGHGGGENHAALACQDRVAP